MNRSKKRLARLCSVVVLAVTVPAEETLWCRSLGVDQGLSQSFITAIAQDRDGFLWFGTLSGLNRWDGYQFESFAHFHEDSASLSDSAVFALHFDRNGRLWVGTDKGIDGYVPTTSAFQRYGTGFRMPDGRTPLRVEGIASDSAGRVWYASFAGPRLYRADPQSGRESEQLIPGLPRGEVSALYVDRADRLWVAVQPHAAELGAEASAPVLFVFDRCGEIGEGPLPAPRRPFTLEVEGGRVAVILEDAAGRHGRDREKANGQPEGA